MSTLDTSAWPFLGKTSNSSFYLIEEGVIAGIVKAGGRDDEHTARENQRFYHELFHKHGPGMLIYSLDRITDQTSGARRAYRANASPELIYCLGLLVDSLMSRAVAMFFVGIARPDGIPVKVSGSLEELLAWGRPICDQRRRRSDPP